MAEVRPVDTVGTFDQRGPWISGFVLHGAVVATLALAGAIMVRSQSDLPLLVDRSTLQQFAGWVALGLAAVGFVFARSWVVNVQGRPQIFTFEKAADRLGLPARCTAGVASWTLTIGCGFAAALGATFLVGSSAARWVLLGAVGTVAGGAVLGAVLPWMTTRSSWESHRWQYVPIAGIALGANGVLAEFDTALKGMTLPGNEQFGFTSFSSVFGPAQALDNVKSAVTNWSAYRSAFVSSFGEAAENGTARPPTEFAATAWHTAIDSLLRGPAIGLLLIGLCAWLLRKVADLGEESERDLLKPGLSEVEVEQLQAERLKAGQLKSILTVGRYAAGLLVVVNAAGNLAGFGVARYFQSFDSASTEATPRSIWVLAMARGLATSAEFVIMAGVLGACAIAVAYSMHCDSSARSTIAALRAHFALVLLLVLLLRNSQSYDAIRTWQSGKGSWGLKPWIVGGTLVLGVAAAVAIRYLGEVVVAQKRLRDEAQRRWQPNVKTRCGYALIELALALVMGFFLQAWGLLVPLGLFVVLEAMNLPLKRRGESETIDNDNGERIDTDHTVPDEETTKRHAVQKPGVKWNGPWKAFSLQLAAAASIGGLGWIAYLVGDRGGARWALIAVAIVGFILALRDICKSDRGAKAVVERPVLPSVLGAVLLVSLGAAVIRSAAGLVIYRAGGGGLLIVGVVFVVLGTVVLVHFDLRARYWDPVRGIAVIRALFTSVTAVYLLVWELASPDWLIKKAQGFGSIAVVLLFLVAAALITTAISYLGDQTDATRALRLLGFKKVPFYLLLLVWVLVGQRFDGGGYHDVDRIPFAAEEAAAVAAESKGIPRDLTSEAVFDEWWQRCGVEAGPNEVVPMVFVAASGGGIRAAYWTASTLDTLTDHYADSAHADRCSNPFFAMSGASGGSVGLATFATHQLAGRTDAASAQLDDDYLAPTVGWTLFVDFTRPFFLWDLDGKRTLDRAGVLARSFELGWDPDPDAVLPSRPETPRAGCGGWTGGSEQRDYSMGLRSAWCLGSSLLMLNGAEVNSGCRVLVSTLDNRSRALGASPTSANCLRPPENQPLTGNADARPDRIGPLGATVDIVDYLCPDQDIAMSVSSIMSARFPLVSPSGRIEPCQTDEDRDDIAYVVDGGYLDNSGASGLVELWAGLSASVHNQNLDSATACIVPIFIQLDNGYDFESAGAPDRPSEILAPILTLFSGQASREAEAKQVASAVFGSARIPGNLQVELTTGDDRELISRWLRIVPDAHPGVQAPLGWILSPAAQEDLDVQLQLELDSTIAHLDQLWGADLSCAEFNLEASQPDLMDAADGE